MPMPRILGGWLLTVIVTASPLMGQSPNYGVGRSPCSSRCDRSDEIQALIRPAPRGANEFHPSFITDKAIRLRLPCPI
jgi:hypothetical protein